MGLEQTEHVPVASHHSNCGPNDEESTASFGSTACSASVRKMSNRRHTPQLRTRSTQRPILSHNASRTQDTFAARRKSIALRKSGYVGLSFSSLRVACLSRPRRQNPDEHPPPPKVLLVPSAP